jgi:Fic family protein
LFTKEELHPLGELITRRWRSELEGLSRQDRRGCDYDAYLPDPLQGWDLTLPADVAADIADAETAVRDLNSGGVGHVSLEGMARFLLRAESVASSYIEGLQAGARRLVEAEFALTTNSERVDQTAVEVLGNVTAMQAAVDEVASDSEITVDHLLAVHAKLMERSARPELGGQVRVTQNWIGGSGYNPCSASFVPPPPEHVPALLDDLLGYVNGDDHSPLTQAALAHAQFEAIHPFPDGNGRTGRALIHVVLRRRSLAPRFVPPISLVLATWSQGYIAGLNDYCYVGPPTSPERSVAAQAWLRTFAAATNRSCTDASTYATRIDETQARWRDQVGRIRRGSALERLVDVLPGVPLVTVESASELTGRSPAAAGDAINRLRDAGVLRQRNVGRARYRVFEAPDVLNLFTRLERSLASPVGDTAAAPPTRTVPARPS